MIEYFLLDKYFKKEKYNNDGKIDRSDDPISFLIGLIFSLAALYFSWTCNTSKGIQLVPKIIYGFFAFIFGIFYLIIYFLFLNDCKKSL